MSGLTALSLVLFLLATYLLSLRRYVWDALLLLFLSGLGLLMRSTRPLPFLKAARPRLHTIFPRTLAGWIRACALLVATAVAFSTRSRVLSDDFTALFVWWLVAVASFAITLLRPVAQRWRDVALSRQELYGLAGLLLVAGLLRFVALGRVPYNLGGDEGTQLVAGLQLIARPLGNPFATGWYSVPTMSFLAYGAGMRLFGATVAGGRAQSAILGTLTVLTMWLLARAVGGRRVGWAAALFVAFSHYHIHFSRVASNQIADPFIGTLALWLLWGVIAPNRRSETQAVSRWGLCGIVAGVGWYAYFGARWVTLLIGLIVVWRVLVEPRFLVRHWRGLLTLACGWLVVVLPLLGWYTTHPSPLTERYNAVSVFASGWLAREVVATGKTPARLLLQQLWKAASAFHLTPDPTFWYFPEAPLLDFVTGALMLVGMVAALVRVRWPSRALVLIWFWSTLVMAWVLTENPPSSQRGLLLLPAAALFAAWGLDVVWQKLIQPAWLAALVATILLGSAALLNVDFYFGDYTPRRIYGNPTAEKMTSLAYYVRENPHPACGDTVCRNPVYFFGPPFVYWDFGSLAFLLHGQPGVNVQPEERPRLLTQPVRMIFVPERLGELEAMKAAYPDGVVREVTTQDQRVLAVIYDW